MNAEDLWMSSEKLFEWFQSARQGTHYEYKDFLKKMRKICRTEDLVE